jgi:predicted metal-dependent RNase
MIINIISLFTFIRLLKIYLYRLSFKINLKTNILNNIYYNILMQSVSILPLGAGCEVGRSCLILTINNKKIMLDCGLMINKEDTDSLPLFDKINAE